MFAVGAQGLTSHSTTVGTCSRCGGKVTLPFAWWSVVEPTPTCEGCGATSSPHGPVIPMDTSVL